MGVLTSPHAQGRLRSREKRQEEERRATVAAIMGLPEGRRFMYDLIFNRCGLMDAYPGQDSGIYRHEGKRELGQVLARELQENHTDSYIRMITERMREQDEDKAVRAAVNDQSGDDDA